MYTGSPRATIGCLASFHVRLHILYIRSYAFAIWKRLKPARSYTAVFYNNSRGFIKYTTNQRDLDGFPFYVFSFNIIMICSFVYIIHIYMKYIIVFIASACIGKLPTGNISTGYQKQRKKDTSPRRKVSKVNLWFRKCVLRGWRFFIHIRPIRTVTNESILSAFSGSGREKRVFNWNPIFFLSAHTHYSPRQKLWSDKGETDIRD